MCENNSDKNTENDGEKLAQQITEKLSKDLLICCFCSEEYLFDFTMKHHLIKEHKKEIMELDNWPTTTFKCIYCNAFFYYKTLLPKHILFSHSKKELDRYFEMDDNFQKFQIDKENLLDPSFKLLDCSPELSKMFNELDTCDSVKKFKRNDNSAAATPKSILKKTPHSGKIVILSPESVALKRTINNLKRSASARRELRFDLPPLQPSPEAKTESLPPLNFGTPPSKKKHFWSFMTRSKSPPAINGKIKKKLREKACKMSNRSVNYMVTSTPMSYIFNESDADETDNSIDCNWKTATKSSDFKPLFLTAERFQCNHCKIKFDSNYELIAHQKEKHKWISFRPAFKCGSCGTKFFRNSLLVRHCRHQHTPSKSRP